MLKTVLAFNGSPRTNWNTAKLLKEALKGAESLGAKTELIHLDSLNFSGCKSCQSCKIIGGKRGNGIVPCPLQDDFTSILKKIEKADAILLGTPVYTGAESSLARKFIERALYPYYQFDAQTPGFPKKIKTGLIYTMESSKEEAAEQGYPNHFALTQSFFQSTYGHCEVLPVYFTTMLKPCSKYHFKSVYTEKRLQTTKEQFPLDLKKAFDLGKRLVE